MDLLTLGVISDPNASACQSVLSYNMASILAIISSVLGIMWTGYNILMLRRIDLESQQQAQGEEGLIQDMPSDKRKLLMEFGFKTFDAGLEFLKLQYLFCLVVVVISFLLLWFLTERGPSAAISFMIGALVSVISGVASFILATRSSSRIAYCSKFGLGPTFRTAYQAASAIGFGIASISLLVITISIEIYKDDLGLNNSNIDPQYFRNLFETVAGYGLGSSMVALFSRLGGGIFETATQSGSELIGKTQGSLPFNHTRNAATVALHAGHNIGGVVGAGSDLLGSYSQMTCVGFLLSSTSILGWQGENAPCGVTLSSLVLPLTILSIGLIVSIGVNLVGVMVVWVESHQQLMKTIRLQRLISGILMMGFLYLCVFLTLPNSFILRGVSNTFFNPHSQWEAYACSFFGNLAFLLLALYTEFATSKDQPFVQALADKYREGPAAALTLGLAFGYISSFAPAIIISFTAYFSYQLLGFYGLSIAVLAFLATLPLQLALQTLGPLASDALTSASIANLNQDQKQTAKYLAQSGESASVVSRGVSMGCSALIGLTLLGGFLRNAHLDTEVAEESISLNDPLIFSGLLVGAIFPFILSGLTVRGSRKAIDPFVQQIQRQLKEDEGIGREESEPDYTGSVRPSSKTTIKHLIVPVVLVVTLPLIFGLVLSPKLIAGLLLGVIVSGFQFAASATTSGEAWSAACQHIENGGLSDEDGKILGVGSGAHRAALIGKSVGIALRKNAGCSLNSSIKLMGMLAVLFGSKFAQLHP